LNYDSDDDDVIDIYDNCPDIPNTDQANADSDNVGDICDGCPTDPDYTEAGLCGCGNPAPGTSCDDGISLTIQDQIGNDCKCSGIRIGYDYCCAEQMKDEAPTGNITLPGGDFGDQLNHLTLYPNPGTSGFQLHYTVYATDEVTLHVSRITGELHYKMKKEVSPGEISVYIDMRSASPGMFLVSIQTSKGIETQRWVKND
jgi:hypothetical protein